MHGNDLTGVASYTALHDRVALHPAYATSTIGNVFYERHGRFL